MPEGNVPSPGAQNKRLQELEAVLKRFDIHIAEANDLVCLEGYKIIIIADDSGSMSAPAQPPGQRSLFEKSASRWEELREAVALIVDIGTCFDPEGVHVRFLNRAEVTGIRSSQDPRLLNAFVQPPNGGTPLTEQLHHFAQNYYTSERPILLFILTDGEPNGGAEKFSRVLADLVQGRSTKAKFRVQIMACTGDEDAVGWLNDLDTKFSEVDVTDDYYSEMLEVVKKHQSSTKFTRGDWCMKAMLGPVSQKFDSKDEKKARKESEVGCYEACVIA